MLSKKCSKQSPDWLWKGLLCPLQTKINVSIEVFNLAVSVCAGVVWKVVIYDKLIVKKNFKNTCLLEKKSLYFLRGEKRVRIIKTVALNDFKY